MADDISRSALRAVFTHTNSLPGVLSRRQKIMGGHGTITLVGGNEQLLEQCWALADTCEQLWSRFRDDSDISRINWAEGKPVRVAPMTHQLIAAMISGNTVTQGTYDPTLLPDVLQAGYVTSAVDSSRSTRLPESARAPGNLKGIQFSDEFVSVPRGTTLDPGGIAKGFAADLIAQFALDQGAYGVMVELGGDIVVQGDAPDGVAWRLGVQDPFAHEGHASIVRLQRGAIATSSQVKKRFGEGENSTHHLINPVTHSSAHTQAQTVTVIAASGARAEVLTKRGFMDSPEEFLSWLPSVGGAGLIIFADGSQQVSPNWSTYA
ncbi:FAD:protein FMN transferase [Aurantimicrobium photophilum]|uniref:FAD:protein FMN transferase n=1 Tax=Aurantimicrobium photophilum TaxID=1987356 RepID=A0A2Z3S6G8_9MICO|nr:FAD:protein FMN transferase [Aurantimicrobium photophilum]AWR22338.1 Thiamine biosynthesis lipoprotein ApbE precursor [Aurantimicrobium photophilum]